MANVNEAQFTSTLVGVKEDVVNKLFNVAPHRHAFTNSIKKGTCANEIVEWLTDEDRAVNGGLAVDFKVPTAGDYKSSTPTLLSNRVERFEEFVQVGDKAMSNETYGNSSAFNYQTAKAIKSIRDGVETRLIGPATTARASTKNSVGARMANYQHYVTTNSVAAAGAMTEDHINELMEKIWKISSIEGNYNLLLSPANKRKLSKLLEGGSTRRNLGWSGKKKSVTFDGYQGDFGMISIMPSQFITDSEAYLYTPMMFEHTTLKGFNPKITGLAKESRSTRAVIDTACTLKSLNEKASGKITGIA